MGNRFSLGRCDRLRRRFAAASVEQNYGQKQCRVEGARHRTCIGQRDWGQLGSSIQNPNVEAGRFGCGKMGVEALQRCLKETQCL